jgi:hypothetical protein
MGDQKPGFYLNICRRDAEFVSETGFFSLSRYCRVRRHQPCVIIIENLGATHPTYLLIISIALSENLVKKIRLKKEGLSIDRAGLLMVLF